MNAIQLLVLRGDALWFKVEVPMEGAREDEQIVTVQLV